MQINQQVDEQANKQSYHSDFGVPQKYGWDKKTYY